MKLLVYSFIILKKKLNINDRNFNMVRIYFLNTLPLLNYKESYTCMYIYNEAVFDINNPVHFKLLLYSKDITCKHDELLDKLLTMW